MDDSESTPAYTRRHTLRLGAGLAAGGASIVATSTASAQSDAYGGYLSGQQVGWNGETIDKSGNEEVTISVGAGPQGLQFGPKAVLVDPGTNVTWEWTGNGGGHNVVDEDGAFEAEIATEEGHTFEHTFEESGATQYFCSPHKAIGMKGVVVVGEDNVEGELVSPGGGGGGLQGNAIAAGTAVFSVVTLLGIAAYREIVDQDTGGY